MEAHHPDDCSQHPEPPILCNSTDLQVANAMAAKAKLLMRELKTVKADLAFSRERCKQLEDENKIHREADDMIGLQLETLLAEKAHLANENSTYAREQIPKGDCGVPPTNHARCRLSQRGHRRSEENHC